ncbi:MAG: carboxypeptidase regulatory-like domain-containing protein [candidate division Zixibacteria bacterium]|nr:carboxypeptidase regulatory-like domain-containing protein [candidate division Zixibacteria bacterium]
MRFVKISALAILIALTAFNFAYAEWSGASGEQYISSFAPTNTKVYCPAFAVGPNYELYAVWAQSDYPIPYEVHFSKSTDNGVTWSGTSGDQMISANDGDGVYNMGIYGARRIDIAVNSVGWIYVVWPEDYITANFDTTIEIMMVMSSDGGTSWAHSNTDFPISDTTSFVTANSPNIAIDNDDNIHVVWNQKNAQDTSKIFYSMSSNYGDTWTGRSADRYISFRNGHHSAMPDIDVDVNNNIHVVWRDYYSSTDCRILYGVSTDGGTSFSSETSDSVVSIATYSIVYPQIKAKPFAGHVHIIYAYNDTAMYVGTTDGGANWNETMIWAGQSYDMYAPDIAVTTTGTMIAILDEQPPGSTNRQIYASYSFDYGLHWSAALDPVSNYDPVPTFDRTYIPSVLITNTDVLHCLYSTNYPSSSNSYQEMAYSRSDSLGTLPGVISGTVTELDGTTPIDSVAVTAYDSVMVVSGTDITDVNGDYYMALSPGTYSVNFSIYTHHDSTVAGILVEENLVAGLDISLNPMLEGIISGYVYEETGANVLDSVIVEILDGHEVLWATDTTDAAGYYEFSLFPNTYDIRFSRNLFEDTTVTGQILTEGGFINLDVNMSWAIPADDIGLVSLDAPIDFMLIDESYTPAITVENPGYQQQTFDLNLTIDDGLDNDVYNETITGIVLDSLSSAQQVFGVDFTPEMPGDYYFYLTVINPDDEETSNDSMTVTITCYQHQGVGGPDNYGHRFKDNTVPCGPVFNWIDISSTGTQIEPGSHYFMSDPLYLGFRFEFYGVEFDTIWVNSHGSVHIGHRSSWLMTNDCPVPSETTPYAPMAMVNWNEAKVQYEIGQGVYYQYFDEPVNDYTIVQWNVSSYDDDDTLEFEVIFYEDGTLLYQYNNVSEHLPSGQGQESTIGIEYDVEDPYTLDGLSYLCDDDNPANRLVDGLAILWHEDTGVPGVITGVVTNASTGDSIENVFVEVVGFGLDGYTDENGQYTLSDVDACTYDVEFSHDDYNDTTIAGVIVTSGNTTVLDVEMSPAAPDCFQYMAGDVNQSLGLWIPRVIGGDVTFLVNYFKGSTASVPCMMHNSEAANPYFWASADANGDCIVMGSDVIKLVGYFRGAQDILWCADYLPCWHPVDPTFDPPPATAPTGWPNCATPPVQGRVIPNGSTK